MLRSVIVAVLVVAAAAASVWQYRRLHPPQAAAVPAATAPTSAEWLDRLYGQNPRDAEQASQHVTELGERALPTIEAVLRDPQAEAEKLKAALKAVGILGRTALPVIDDVASLLQEPALTAEASVALSYMGPDAVGPLREALTHEDPMVRREALRAIGKLKDRAPLDISVVLPLLIERMKDPNGSVRAVAATYLGIIHQGENEAVPALVEGLSDPEPEVRRASAAALGSFGAAAAPALPALKRAAADKHDDVASEAGRAIVKLQQK
jgi:HEAT repeat protein